MTRALLVIDKPVNCWQCPCYSDYDCNVLNVCVFDDYGNPRDIQCPLKPIPEKMRTDAGDIEEDSYWQGWNECLDAITREGE